MIIGLDLSINSTGMAVYDGKDVEVSVISTEKGMNYYDRIHFIWEKIQSKTLSYSGKPSDFFIEDYSFGAFGKSSSVTTLAELGGFIKVSLHNHRLCNKFALVPVTVIKKFICGFGNAKKSDMKLEFYKKFNFSYKTDDEVDAHSLLILGAAASGVNIYSRNWIGYETNCIDKVKGLLYPGATLTDRLSRVQ